MATYTFTVEEILAAAEQDKYPNFNDYFLQMQANKTIKACVIGEAFLNLGMVPNGIEPAMLSDALRAVKPDDTVVELGKSPWGGPQYAFDDLSHFINELNGVPGYRGKKRIVRLARKYFSKSLDQKVTIKTRYGDDEPEPARYGSYTIY